MLNDKLTSGLFFTAAVAQGLLDQWDYAAGFAVVGAVLLANHFEKQKLNEMIDVYRDMNSMVIDELCNLKNCDSFSLERDGHHLIVTREDIEEID